MNPTRLILSVAFCLGPSGAHASSGNLNFNGALIASACTVTTPNQTVTLPTLATSSVRGGVNSLAGMTFFSIALTGCTPSVAQVSIWPEYQPGDGALGLIKNTGTASGVMIYVTAVDPVTSRLLPLSDNQSSPNVAVSGAGTAMLWFAAGYKRLPTAITAGTVTGSMRYSVVYN